ncbi:MAG: carbohydrate kinase [Pseudomonadota bacterium]
MSIAILSSQSMANLESAALAEVSSVRSLIETAVSRCTELFQELYPSSKHSHVALLVGTGHNGCDALGIGCELLREGRSVIALIAGSPPLLKPETSRMHQLFVELGGTIKSCSPVNDEIDFKSLDSLRNASVWIDGLFGFGLNRPVTGIAAEAIQFINGLKKEIVSLDIPSGLSCDLGYFDGNHITATRTFVLGAYKPAHVDELCVGAIGQLHLIDLDLLSFRQRINAPDWTALDPKQLSQLIESIKRKSASHKVSNGKILIIAGSRRYPGAAVLACLGASVSGAGLIHALVPESSQTPLLTLQPEIIFETRLPNLDKFNSIVLGPGWVPGNSKVFEEILLYASAHPNIRIVLDAGCFHFVKERLNQGARLHPNFVLTPHYGEFSKLFPEITARIETTEPEFRINRLEAVSWATSLSSAHIVLKGARTHIASPDGSVASIIRSSPLLAHAGQGDVFAGLLGGICAHTHELKKAACLAAMLQAEVALQFSSAHPCALTLQPSELVRQLPSFLPSED